MKKISERQITHRKDGSVRYEAWWIDGINLIKEEYLAWHRNKIIEKYLAD